MSLKRLLTKTFKTSNPFMNLELSGDMTREQMMQEVERSFSWLDKILFDDDYVKAKYEADQFYQSVEVYTSLSGFRALERIYKLSTYHFHGLHTTPSSIPRHEGQTYVKVNTKQGTRYLNFFEDFPYTFELNFYEKPDTNPLFRIKFTKIDLERPVHLEILPQNLNITERQILACIKELEEIADTAENEHYNKMVEHQSKEINLEIMLGLDK